MNKTAIEWCSFVECDYGCEMAVAEAGEHHQQQGGVN